MSWFINVFIIIPIVGFIISLMVSEKKELVLSRVAFYTSGATFFAILFYIVYWALSGFESISLNQLSLYSSKSYEFIVSFYFDKVSAVYLVVGALLTFMITLYSRYYLHREKGYKRFFNTILFFYIGYNFTILSGNFETLFLGWEMLGMSSFLLIAFYRDRYLPVRNAVKVFSIYRIGDVGILIAMWASHHLWHGNITFHEISNPDFVFVKEHLKDQTQMVTFISIMILIAAAAKSAQLPFSSWLPRAMEGPTPSSAIFYGSLSVHLGVFLLLRTFTYWEQQIWVRVTIAVLGISTSLVTSSIARVQSSVKSQIAYSSIAQIGLIFLEIALGLNTLALIHFAGNAFLRTYQLLVSPSVVSYLIKEQFYNFKPRLHTVEDSFPKRMERTFYMLSLKEWYLDYAINKFLFSPLKKLGQKLDFLTVANVFFFFVPIFVSGLLMLYMEESMPKQLLEILPELFSGIGLALVLKSFSEKKYPRLAWLLVIMYHYFIALAVSFNEHFDINHTIFYLSGITYAGICGYICLQVLRSAELKYFNLYHYHGHVYEYKTLAFVFFLCCLGLMGFPITPSFIGVDLIFSHIHEDQFVLATFNAVGFIMGGIAVIRIFTRLFLGPHDKTYHSTPFHLS